MLAFQLGAQLAGTLPQIQDDLFICFHSGTDVNGDIVIPVCIEVKRNIVSVP